MNKTTIINNLKQGMRVIITSPKTHKWYNIPRKVEKMQTQSARFEGGSWLYFNEIDMHTADFKGFSLVLLEGQTEEDRVTYAWIFDGVTL